MQTTTAKLKFPVLHFLYAQNPNKYFEKVSYEKFSSDYNAEADEVLKGIMGLIVNNKALGGTGIIIEGSLLTPRIMDKIVRTTGAKHLSIIYKTKSQLKKNFKNRGLWTTVHSAQLNEEQAIWNLNEDFLAEAKKLKQKFVFAEAYGTLYARAIKAIKL